MDSRAGSLVAVVVLFLVLTWVTFSLRIYVRSAISRSWGMDDWALLLTVVSSLGHQRKGAVSQVKRLREDSSSALPNTYTNQCSEWRLLTDRSPDHLHV